jgi:hypothetical protein
MRASATVEAFLDRLNGVKADGTGWSARCPCRNDDENPSLHVGEGRDGRVLVTCHRGGGCDLPEICEAMSITVNDLFPADKPKSDEKPKLVHTYDYRDEHGTLLFQKQRYAYADGKKTFRQRRPNDDGSWSYSLGDVPKVLYRLPQVSAAAAAGDTVFVVEGEKDADALVAAGYIATTMPGGAGKWLELHTKALVGATVQIVRDNDDAGIAHAVQVYEALTAAGITVALLAPAAGHKDVADVLAAGGTVADLVGWSPDAPAAPDLFDELIEQIAVVRGKPLDDAKKLIRIRGVLDRLDPNVTQVGDPGRLVNWTDFIDEPVDESYNWVVPGVLERQDRVIVVAAEGVGKTMLSRQMAITTAYGVHPFTFEPMAPVATLTVDLENPERIIRRMSTNIIRNAARLSKEVAGAHLLIRPAGMDLLNPADRIVLEEAIERIQPGLVCVGPLYKSFVDSGTRTSEALAVDIAKYLDYLRTTYNFALWIEHHAPLGGSGGRELRPFGSAVWSRWPEFGWTLEPDLTAEQPHVYKWGRFRNDREPRHRPTKVKRGKVFPFEVLEFFKVD